MSATLTIEIIHAMRQRRSAGERVSKLATELGMRWQKLDKALRHGVPSHSARAVDRTPPPPIKSGSLAERYRPRTLAALVGQDDVVARLQGFVATAYPTSMLFEGETGTGKTSAAWALASDRGCATEQQEFGGVWSIASGDQSADAVRQMMERMWQTPFYGSGWRVLIVNEADRMSTAAETVWLDRLECMPARTVVVFTTNQPGRMSARFRDRCLRFQFQSDHQRTIDSARRLLTSIWTAETGQRPDQKMIREVAASAIEDGNLSFRRCVQSLQLRLLGDVSPGRIEDFTRNPASAANNPSDRVLRSA